MCYHGVMKIASAKILDEIRQKHNLSLILLHGSQTTGMTHAKSDVDIAVLSCDKKQKVKQLELIMDLHEALDTRDVDLTVLDHADPLLLKTVTDKAQLLSGTNMDFFKLKLFAFNRYNDYLPYLKMEANFVRSQL